MVIPEGLQPLRETVGASGRFENGPDPYLPVGWPGAL